VGGSVGALQAMARTSFWGSLGQTKRVRRCAQERGVRGAEKERQLQPDLTGIRSFELPVLVDDGDKFMQPGGPIRREGKEERERGVRGSYRQLLRAVPSSVAAGGGVRSCGSGERGKW
jgi:hypothetical protein